MEQFALLDSVQAIQNFGGNESIFLDLLKSMIKEELPEKEKQMKEAYQKRQFEQVEKLAHSLKGAAVYVGVTRLKYAASI